MDKIQLKQKFIHELRVFLFYFIFLTLFFWTFTMYRHLILKEFQISYIHYSYNFIEALVLSKMIILGQSLKLGERYSDRKLIIPTLYKTVIFSIFVLIFTILEEFVVGFIKGHSFTAIYHTFSEIGIYEISARVLVMFFVFVLLFAFLEIDRIMGGDNLINLFMRERNPKDTHKN